MRNRFRHKYTGIAAGTLGFALVLSGCGASGGDNITLTGSDDPGGDGSADPVVVDTPLFYIQRQLPLPSSDFTDPLAFSPGSRLLSRQRAANDAEPVDLTPRLLQMVAELRDIPVEDLLVDIKHLSAGFDGDQLLFSARVVQEPIDDNVESTTWNLWRYSISDDELSYVITDPIARDEGFDRHDLFPVFLPNDTIIFSSTRQQGIRQRQLDVGRPQYAGLDEDRNQLASVLHNLDPDTQVITQISYNQSHDLAPSVMPDGSIVFSRWENAQGSDAISLYSMLPDGSELSLLYGHDSHELNSDAPDQRIEYTSAHALADGGLASFIRPRTITRGSGNVVSINIDGFSDYQQPLWSNLADSDVGHSALLPLSLNANDTIDTGGSLAGLFPVFDGTGRFLMSWSPCRTIEDGRELPCTITGDIDDETVAAPANYGLWLYDPRDGTQRPVVLPERGKAIVEAVLASNRDFPPIVSRSETFDASLAAQRQALLQIGSVYDINGEDRSPGGYAAVRDASTNAYRNRTARFLRIVTPVPIPDENTLGDNLPGFAFGRSSAQLMREITGYVPIEPDGSVTAVVPANTPFMISVLDANGRRISARHNQWLQLGAGEVRQCSGCHERNSTLPHGRYDDPAPLANPGAASLSDGTFGFPNIGIRADSIVFPNAEGLTMAQLFDLLYPLAQPSEATRAVNADVSFVDVWTDTSAGLTKLEDIQVPYDASWTPDETPYVRIDGEPALLRINYLDHIQPIWERVREISDAADMPVLGTDGNPVTQCIGCHAGGQTESGVPAGQLDLSSMPSDQNPDHVTSYRELLFTDTEQWLVEGIVVERTRICSREELNDEGELVTVPFNDPQPPRVPPVMSVAGANFGASRVFYGCFESGAPSCSNFNQQPEPPENCEETGTLVTDEPFDHNGLLSDAEKRLIGEWLDIGGQYFNDPFHPVLLDSL
ncbi:Uncharacterised protein [BD1-7 clade bacterium]|uniref:Hydrazine synthase alpha subunit middle domain-containing protein n=1 Tax=BD1-7 clade bacterium TaxID=2029982 RepID=A0A5S9P6H0_9GAMM|nr:Uncharacterised protein [BD1-7 clade bacterium]CAA0099107.1 Uncharacterised protein [BD1-7 clade bacterium]